MNWLKAFVAGLIVFLLALFLLSVFGYVNPWAFWICAGVAAVLAFVVLPRIKGSGIPKQKIAR